VLDLTDAQVREALAVTEDDLTRDDLTRCQTLGDAARVAGLEGVLAPSGTPKLTEEQSRVQRAPARLRALVSRIRRLGHAMPPSPDA
jgi:RES domain-containing protein